MKKILFYTNQFFGQIGGEDQAGVKPFVKEDAIGPGMMVNQKIENAQVVASVVCGDNYYAENMETARTEILSLIKTYDPDLFFAGPGFNAGRFGIACADLCAAVEKELGIPAITGLNEENPAVQMYRDKTLILRVGKSAAAMRTALPEMIKLSERLLSGEKLSNPDMDNYFSKGIRINDFHEKYASERALDMLVAKLSGQTYKTEIPLPTYQGVTPAQPITDLSKANIALVTTGGVVPFGNPDRLPAATGKFAKRYDIGQVKSLMEGAYESVHAGFDPVYVNKDPNRVMPLDTLRQLEDAGIIGRLNHHFYTTTGNSTSVADATRIGEEIAQQLIEEGVNGVIMTST